MEQIFNSANTLCFEKDYNACAARFETLVEAGVRDPDVFFNLANAYAHNQQCGKALVNFERAALLETDQDIEQGQQYCKQVLFKKNISQFKNLQFDRGLEETLRASVPLQSISLIFLISNALFFGLLLITRFPFVQSRKKILRGLALISGFILLISAAGIVALKNIANASHVSIIIAEKTPVLSAPNSGTLLKNISFFEGERVYVEEKYDQFIKARSVDGRHGWISEKDALSVIPQKLAYP